MMMKTQNLKNFITASHLATDTKLNSHIQINANI